MPGRLPRLLGRLPRAAFAQGRKPSLRRELNELVSRVQNLRRSHPFEFWYVLGAVAAVTGFYLLDQLSQRTQPFERMAEDVRLGQASLVTIERVSGSAPRTFARVELLDGSSYRVSVLDRAAVTDLLAGSEVRLSEQFAPSHFRSFAEFLAVSNAFLFGAYMLRLVSAKKGAAPLDVLQSFEKSLAKRYTREKGVVRFADVAGLREAKREVEEFVDFLRAPGKYERLGAKLPKGALLAGPPGTGKTLLAKACAGEANVPFFYVSGSEFVQMFVGVGAARVRDLFAEAQRHAPSIVFIDEIDAVGKQRSARLSSNSEMDSTLNQLLVELDGFKPNAGVVVFAATNRKELLDPALTRPGRIDRIIDVAPPDLDGRREILEVHLRKLRLGGPGELERHARRLASLTPGFCGADLANACNEAGIEAVRAGHAHVQDADFEQAVERIVAGVRRGKAARPEDERVVAVHEAGHGVVSWFLPGADPLLKLTIVPRSKGALGFAQYLPPENSIVTEQELLDKITAVLAGRCAEEAFFGRVTTGAHDDIQKATRLAASIVKNLGMSGVVGLAVLEESEEGLRACAEKTQEEADGECRRILAECTARARELVRLHRDKIERLVAVLLEQKTIDLRAIRAVLGERPFPPQQGFEAYLRESEAP